MRRSAWRSAGKNTVQSPVMSRLPTPPSTTARTAPNQWAVRPDSYSPNSLEAPRNSQFTLDTRPRISGGVASCRMLERTTTLTMSVAPVRTRAMQLSHKLRLRPKTTVAAPNPATHASMVLPAFRLSGKTLRLSDTASAPRLGMARNKPSACAPRCRMSEAKIGSRLTAPPSSTAKRSSEMEPSSKRVRST